MKRRRLRKGQKPIWPAWVASGLVLLVGVSVTSYFLETRGSGLLIELQGPHSEPLRLLGAALVGSAMAAYLVVGNALRVSPAPSRTRRLVRRALEIDFTDPDVVQEFASVPELRELVGILVGEKSQNRELSDRLETLRGEVDGLVAAMQHSLLDRGRIRVESLSEVGAELAGLWNTLAERAQKVEVADSPETFTQAQEVAGSLEERLARIETDVRGLKSQLEIPLSTTPVQPARPWDPAMTAPAPILSRSEESTEHTSEEATDGDLVLENTSHVSPVEEDLVIESTSHVSLVEEDLVIENTSRVPPVEEDLVIENTSRVSPVEEEGLVIENTSRVSLVEEGLVIENTSNAPPVEEDLVIENTSRVSPVEEGLVVESSREDVSATPAEWVEPVIPEPSSREWDVELVQLPEPKPEDLARGSDLEPVVALRPDVSPVSEFDPKPVDVEPTVDLGFEGFALPQFKSRNTEVVSDRVEVTYEAQEGEDVQDLPASAVLFDSIEEEHESIEDLSQSGKQEYTS